MHDARLQAGPSARPSLLDLVCVAVLTALLFWGAYAIAGLVATGRRAASGAAAGASALTPVPRRGHRAAQQVTQRGCTPCPFSPPDQVRMIGALSSVGLSFVLAIVMGTAAGCGSIDRPARLRGAFSSASPWDWWPGS